MQNYQRLALFTIFSALLLSQIPPVVFAHHNDDAGEKTRQEKEVKTKQINDEDKKKYLEIKDAWNEYRNSFNSWKIAKENYKEVIGNGSQVQIDSAKIISDQAFLDVVKAWNEYQNIRKEYKK